MNRTLLTLIASTALSLLASEQGLARHHPHHGDELATCHTPKEMAQKCEQNLEKIKGNEGIATLPDDQKAEFDHNLRVATIEGEALNNPNLEKYYKKHGHSCHHHLKSAWRILNGHNRQQAREKKKAERQAKANERKAEREAAKAKKEAEKVEKKEEVVEEVKGLEKQEEKVEKVEEPQEKEKTPEIDHPEVPHSHIHGTDHGHSEGASEHEPGTEARKPFKE